VPLPGQRFHSMLSGAGYLPFNERIWARASARVVTAAPETPASIAALNYAGRKRQRTTISVAGGPPRSCAENMQTTCFEPMASMRVGPPDGYDHGWKT